MNAVEIEEAVSALAAEPFNPPEFPFAFLAAFDNKETTIKRRRARSRSAVYAKAQNHFGLCSPIRYFCKTQETEAQSSGKVRNATRGFTKGTLVPIGLMASFEDRRSPQTIVRGTFSERPLCKHA